MDDKYRNGFDQLLSEMSEPPTWERVSAQRTVPTATPTWRQGPLMAVAAFAVTVLVIGVSVLVVGGDSTPLPPADTHGVDVVDVDTAPSLDDQPSPLSDTSRVGAERELETIAAHLESIEAENRRLQATRQALVQQEAEAEASRAAAQSALYSADPSDTELFDSLREELARRELAVAGLRGSLRDTEERLAANAKTTEVLIARRQTLQALLGVPETDQ